MDDLSLQKRRKFLHGFSPDVEVRRIREPLRRLDADVGGYKNFLQVREALLVPTALLQQAFEPLRPALARFGEAAF